MGCQNIKGDADTVIFLTVKNFKSPKDLKDPYEKGMFEVLYGRANKQQI